MKFCRYDNDCLGLIEGDEVFDITPALETLPQIRWPIPLGDPLIAYLPEVMEAALNIPRSKRPLKLSQVRLHSPLCNPSKVMAAPANYRLHVQQDTKDPGVDVGGVHSKALEGVERPSEKYGLFLKATSAIAGPSEGVQIILPDRRTDYEVELGVVIGKAGHSISRANAMSHVAGYCIGLDMTVRGTEDRSFRKSPDSYTVLGPCFVTADEIKNPHALTLSLWINEERRQHSSTGAMTMDIPDLIELASRVYTLHPGDVILTGTPEGVGPVLPGDVIRARCDGIGEMIVQVSQHA